MSSPSTAAPAKDPMEASPTASAVRFRSPAQRTLVLCLLLSMAVLLAYAPVVHNGFINFDDDGYILDNPHVRAGLTWATVQWAFTTYYKANWHPLTWLSHALDCQMFGVNPIGHHYMNVLLHAGNAALLFVLLQSATGFRWRSLMVAALFALHPINVEPVAWAAERKTGLSTLFVLLALWAYEGYARRPQLHRYAAVFCGFALALLAKPQAIAFPLLLLLWDYWPLRRMATTGGSDAAPHPGNDRRISPAWLVAEKLPLLLLAVVSAVVTMKAQSAGNAVKSISAYGPLLRLETAAVSYLLYLKSAAWPSHLVALYPHPTQLYPGWQVAAAVGVLLLITVWVFRVSNRRYLTVGWLWFLVSMFPMIGLIQVGAQARADRYAYLSFVGLFLMVTWRVADWADARPSGRGKAEGWLAVCAATWLLTLGALTYRQVGYWHDIPSFWQRTLALTQGNYVAHDMLGEYLVSQGRNEEAAAHFRAALAIRPDDLPATMDLGVYEYGRGNLAGAIALYGAAAQGKGDAGFRANAYANLGSAYRQMGNFPIAKKNFAAALQLNPRHPVAELGLGLIAQRQGDAAEAVRRYAQFVAFAPSDVGYLLLAGALRQQGKMEEAQSIVERVARVSPNLEEAQATVEQLLAGK